MGKALLAVGTFLALCMVILAGVVYFTRDEDTYAVDSALAERFAQAVVRADATDEPFAVRSVTPFTFDEVTIFEPGTPLADVSERLGFEFKGELRYTAESTHLLVFTDNGRFVRFADYRGRGTFVDLDEPFTTLSADDAVFRVEDGEIRRG